MTKEDICGTCGENHCTNKCSNNEKLSCASCKTNEHMSWDRNCPEFRQRCDSYDNRYPENRLTYFPTAQDWTLVARPIRILLEDHFPQNLAAKSIPSGTCKLPTLPTDSPQNRGTAKGKEKAVDKLMYRM